MPGTPGQHAADDIELGAPPSKKVVVIGAGFAGLSAACTLAKEGFDVTVLERLPEVGGRCRTWSSHGYHFDMGPSWYWMPDVFDDFFASFGRKTSDYYTLRRLDPPYRLFLANGRTLDVPDRMQDLEVLFERTERGAGKQLRAFMAQARYKYDVAMSDYVRRPSLRLSEFMDLRMLREAFRLDMFRSQAAHVRSFFKHPDLVAIMEWPVLFLGGSPKSVPAMYSLMNYAAVELGTWYPIGGMSQIPRGMAKLAEELGVRILCGEQYGVERILVEPCAGGSKGAGHGHAGGRGWLGGGGKGTTTGVLTGAGVFHADFVVGAGDYHHMEQVLLEEPFRFLSAGQWDAYTMSPSSLLFYLGVSKRLNNLRHHNLFFDEDLEQHAHEIYVQPQWPSKPLFYVCLAALSDPTCAPQGHENLFVLIPLAAGLTDTEELRDRYYDVVMARLEAHTGQAIRECVTVKRSYAMRDFERDYRSYKGNAYGLANTL